MDVGTRVSSGIPAVFKVSFQGKAGNTAVENWVLSLLHRRSSSSPQFYDVITNCCHCNSVITIFFYSARDSQSPLRKCYTLTAVTGVSGNTESEIVPNTLKSQNQSAVNGVFQTNDT